jgi:hypothetical protein
MNATTTFLQSQINEMKSQLKNHSNCDYWKSENGRVQGQLIQLIDQAFENGEDTVSVADLCEIIDYNPVKEIEFTATISFTGRIEIPMHEAEDFDLEQALEDAYVDINSGNVVIDNYELYDANEC